MDEDDLYIPAPLLPLEFHRAYNSLEIGQQSLGHRWHHSYDWRVTLRQYDGTRKLNGAYLSSASSGSVTESMLVAPTSAVEGLVTAEFLIVQAVVNPQLRGSRGDYLWFQKQTDGSFRSFNQYQAAAQAGGGYTITAPGGVVYGFDASGAMTNIVHPGGQHIQLIYSPTGTVTYNGFTQPRLERVQHSNGQFLDFRYDAVGQLVAVETVATNYGMQFSYSSEGDLTNAVRRTPRGDFSTRYEYQYGEQRYSYPVSGGIGHTNTIEFPPGANYMDHRVDTEGADYRWMDLVSLLIPSVYGDSSSVEVSVPIVVQKYWTRYGSRHWLTKRINAKGEVFHYAYQDSFEATTRAHAMHAGTNFYAVKLDWIGVNEVQETRHRDGINQVRHYFYDPVTKLLRTVVGPNNTNWLAYLNYDGKLDVIGRTYEDRSQNEKYALTYTYDEHHNLTGVAAGYNAEPEHVWTIGWNQADQTPAYVQDPLGGRVSLEYTNALVKALKLHGAGSNVFATSLSYGEGGLLSAITNANGKSIQLAYDPQGYVTNVALASGLQVGIEYNALGHAHKLRLPGAREVAWTPDEAGRPLEATYPGGLTERFAYDGVGHLTNYVDTVGRTSVFDYSVGHITSARQLSRDGAEPGTSITVDYDNQFHALRITDPMGRSLESYELDDADRIIKATNLETQQLSVVYGVKGFIKQLNRFDGSEVSFGYDGQGLLASVDYGSVSNGYSYLASGLLERAENESGSLSNTYDAASRLVQENGEVGGHAFQIARSFYPAGQVSNVTSAAGTVSYQFDAAERIDLVEDAESGFKFTYSTNRGLLSGVAVTNPGGLTVGYAYDDLDRVTNLAWTTTGSGVLRQYSYQFDDRGLLTNKIDQTGSATAYTYDSLDRLVGVASGTSVVQYAYDAAGNRTNTVRNGTPTGWSYGSGDKLTGFGPDTLVQYDAAGNVTTLVYSATRQLDLVWNSRYQLTEVRTNGSTAERYEYDAYGRRVQIKSAGVTNTLVYDGAQVVAEYQNGELFRSYTWGPGIDNLLSFTTHGVGTPSTYYALKDHLGSVVALADSAGQLVESYDYDAWGGVTVRDGSGAVLPQSALGHRYLFQGREYSALTGLYNFRARYYDPTVGRWLSRDPIGLAGGLNQYVFCANNPVNFVDPFGLAVGAPGTWESFIPIWGSGRQAINDFQTGHYVWGIVNTVVAVSDVFLVKAAVTGIAKGAWKVGSHSWRATRAWMGKTGRAEAGQEVHHWAIPQGRWGKNVPDAIKNQPWNLMPMESLELHDALHGAGELGEFGRFMYGSPDWFKALLISEYGRVGNELRDQGQDDCK